MMPNETILSGAPAVCEDCHVAPAFGVYLSAAGYYIGTCCNCGPYSRESGYFPTKEAAEQALKQWHEGNAVGKR